MEQDNIFIHKGEIDFYYPLKIETKLSYDDLCERIQNAINSVLHDYINHMLSGVKDNENSSEYSANDFNEIRFYNPVKEHKGYKAWKYTDPALEIVSDDLFVEIDEETGRIKLKTEAAKEYEKQYSATERDYNYSIRIYGVEFSNTQTRIDFPIFRVQLCNGKRVWLNACLYVFKNKMAVMKIVLPLSDVSSNYLCEYEYDKYISSIDNAFCLRDFNDNQSIDCVEKCFIELLKKVKGIKGMYINGSLSNIILSDYENMPKFIERLDDNLNKMLYKIICAPISEMNWALKNDAKSYIESNCWGPHGIRYITSINGRCLSIIDKNLQNFVVSDFMSCNDLSVISNDERDYVIDRITQDIRINVEFVILVLMLKKLNNSYSLFLKNTEPNKLHETNRAYNEGVLYINSLFSNVYGSVREQLECFERSMIYYLDEIRITQNNEAIDSILSQEKTRQEEKLNNKLTVGSFLLTVFFGLKAINETLMLIRPYTRFFIGGDIPNVTISDVSFVLWIGVILLMIVSILTQYKNKFIPIKNIYLKFRTCLKNKRC